MPPVSRILLLVTFKMTIRCYRLAAQVDSATPIKELANGAIMFRARLARLGRHDAVENGPITITERALFPEGFALAWSTVVFTNDHPLTPVSPESARSVAVGFATAMERDGDYLAAWVVLYDRAAIDAFVAGKREFSIGGFFEMDTSKNVVAITPNHVALVDVGACGPTCSALRAVNQREITMSEPVTPPAAVTPPPAAPAIVPTRLAAEEPPPAPAATDEPAGGAAPCNCSKNMAALGKLLAQALSMLSPSEAEAELAGAVDEPTIMRAVLRKIAPTAPAPADVVQLRAVYNFAVAQHKATPPAAPAPAAPAAAPASPLPMATQLAATAPVASSLEAMRMGLIRKQARHGTDG